MARRRKKIVKRHNIKFKNPFSGLVGRVVMGFLGLLLIGWLSYETWYGMNHSIWNGDGAFSLVFSQKDKVGYMLINPAQEEVIIATFPDKMMIQTAMGYGEYRIEKVSQLAKQEKIPLGVLLDRSMEQFLGRITEGYIVGLSGEKIDSQVFLWQGLVGLAQTNMSRWDMVRLLFFLSGLRYEDVAVVDMEETDALVLDKLADGTDVYRVNQEELDKLVLKLFADPDYLRNSLTWEIFNATNHKGLASQVGRIVANSGFDVVGVRQSIDPVDSSKIVVSKDKVDNNIREFARHIGVTIEEIESDSERSSVQFYIAEDYWKWCCTRQ